MQESANIFEKDDLSTPKLVVIAIVSTVLVLCSVLVIQILYHRYEAAQQQQKVIDVSNVDAETAVAEQMARLARYAWVDQQAGTVTIPIERAMEQVVRDERLRQQQDSL